MDVVRMSTLCIVLIFAGIVIAGAAYMHYAKTHLTPADTNILDSLYGPGNLFTKV
jgi:hypothetical protein